MEKHSEAIETLKRLHQQWSQETVEQVEDIPESGSNRKYFRLRSSSKTSVGTFNPDRKENIAFLHLSEHFAQKNLHVPRIYAQDLDAGVYLQEDLGDLSLYDLLLRERDASGGFSSKLVEIYKQVLSELVLFQVQGAENLDFSICYPRAAFDMQSIRWDLNYFKYYFLKLAGIPFYEQELEDDFKNFASFLLTSNVGCFLYRDLQSRNIMLKDGRPYFIDYQGGRKGAPHYDLASLLFDAKAEIPEDIRQELTDHYLEVLSRHIPIDKQRFQQYYQAYTLVRVLQAMGAYGYRGFFEGKAHFLESIPYALKNLARLLEEWAVPLEMPELMRVLRQLPDSPKLLEISDAQNLTVEILSFSYRDGIPTDTAGNGGGFVFDCRWVHNPGRYPEYVLLTGKDPEVVSFFEHRGEMRELLGHASALVDKAIENYKARGFRHLQVCFGCTGGRHRSVYAAERMAERLLQDKRVRVRLTHLKNPHLNE